MKNLYIKPVTRVVALTNDSVLQGRSEGYETSDFGAKGTTTSPTTVLTTQLGLRINHPGRLMIRLHYIFSK